MTFKEKLIEADRLFSARSETIQGPEDLENIIERFSFNVNEMPEYLTDPGIHPYGRNRVFCSENFEVIVMNWKPFNQCNIHNHGHSFGCVFVVSGLIKNLMYNDDLDLITAMPLKGGAIAGIPRGIYHAIVNETPDYAVSIHFYAPPVDEMTVIEAGNRFESFCPKGNDGAWNSDSQG